MDTNSPPSRDWSKKRKKLILFSNKVGIYLLKKGDGVNACLASAESGAFEVKS
jgi:hypothetical protein